MKSRPISKTQEVKKSIQEARRFAGRTRDYLRKIPPEARRAFKEEIGNVDDVLEWAANRAERHLNDETAEALQAGIALGRAKAAYEHEIAYGHLVRRGHKQLERFPNKQVVTDQQIEMALATCATFKKAAAKLGITERQLRNRRKSL